MTDEAYRRYQEVHHGWEYPEGLDQQVSDGVTAVMRALLSTPDRPKGLPGEVMSLRAIVGLVLSSLTFEETVVEGGTIRRLYEAVCATVGDSPELEHLFRTAFDLHPDYWHQYEVVVVKKDG